jgi:hypothetical protein
MINHITVFDKTIARGENIIKYERILKPTEKSQFNSAIENTQVNPYA